MRTCGALARRGGREDFMGTDGSLLALLFALCGAGALAE